MGKKDVKFQSEESEIVEGLKSYWKDRSPSYSAQNVEEMNNWKRKAWCNLILTYAPKKEVLRVLDVGTGPGFFAMTLALEGHKVTAVDITEHMLEHAAANAKAYGANVRFVLHRGETLPFEDGVFDLIVSRNVIWNLEYPIEALMEWQRVLAPGGRMVYFDANWYLYLFDDAVAEKKKKLYQALRDKYPERKKSGDLKPQRTRDLEQIALTLPMSKVNRPAWDKDFLESIGMQIIHVIEDIGCDVQSEEEWAFNQANPMFMVCAEKGMAEVKDEK